MLLRNMFLNKKDKYKKSKQSLLDPNRTISYNTLPNTPSSMSSTVSVDIATSQIDAPQSPIVSAEDLHQTKDALTAAVNKNDVNEVKKLLLEGADPNEPMGLLFTSVHYFIISHARSQANDLYKSYHKQLNNWDKRYNWDKNNCQAAFEIIDLLLRHGVNLHTNFTFKNVKYDSIIQFIHLNRISLRGEKKLMNLLNTYLKKEEKCTSRLKL